jgi:HK97 family phage major capsid protein
MDKKLAMPTSKPLVGAPGKPEKKGTASDEYRKAMFTAIRTKFRDVSNVLQEGIDEAGGYLVPDEYDRRLIDVLDEENVLRGLATTIRTSGERKINIAATKPAALWVEEGGALTFGDATFDQKLLDAHKLHVAIKITEELLADNAFQLEDYIIAQFGKAIANAEEDAFLNGDGEGKPTGLFADAQVGVTIGTVEIEADDVIDLIYKLKRPYRKKASFITNDSTLAVLRKLKDENGNYLWQPSLQNGEPDRILGYAIRTSQFAPKLAAGKAALAFGDFSYYNIGDRGQRTLQVLKELFAGNGMVGYVMKERVDGLLVLPEAVQVLKVAGTSAGGGSDDAGDDDGEG